MVEELKVKSGGGAAKWVIGCLVGLIALAVLCAGGSYVLFGVLKEKGADWIYDQVMQEIESSGLPPEEVAAIGDHLDRLRDAAVDGEIELENVQAVLEEIEDGPLIPMGMAYGFQSYALSNTELSPDEREEAARDVRRLQKGLWEGTIAPRRGMRIFDRVAIGDEHGEGSWEDVEEIRDIIQEIHSVVEGAGVIDTEFEFDVSDEIGERVDRILGG